MAPKTKPTFGCEFEPVDVHQLLTSREAADALRVSTVTVHRWINAGVLRGIKVMQGASYRISAADVRALLDRVR